MENLRVPLALEFMIWLVLVLAAGLLIGALVSSKRKRRTPSADSLENSNDSLAAGT
jgi:hypothetical protein